MEFPKVFRHTKILSSVKSTASTQHIFRRQRKHKSKNKHSFIRRKIMNLDNFNSQNKLDVLPSFSVDQENLPMDDVEAIPKYHEHPYLFLFEDIACRDESTRFLLFRISNHILYYSSIERIEDQAWCIEHFKSHVDELANNNSVESVDVEKEHLKFYEDNSNQINNKKMNDKREYLLLDKFRNVEYKEIGPIDIVDIMDNYNEIKKFVIKINETSFILGAALVEDKSRFLNIIRFFTIVKERPIRTLLKYGIKGQSSFVDTLSDSEDESIDSEDYDDLNEVVELIEDLSNRCSRHEEDFFYLRNEIDKREKQLSLSIRKFRDLDESAKNLNEKISVTDSRSTKEMEETIDSANKTTETIAEKLALIHTRIRDKSETLKHYQQLLRKLQNQVDLKKRTEKVLVKYLKGLGVIILCIIVVIIVTVVTKKNEKK